MFIRIVVISFVLLGSAAAGAAQTILVFGDSLSAAYGIRQQDGWVALLQQRLQQHPRQRQQSATGKGGERTWQAQLPDDVVGGAG